MLFRRKKRKKTLVLGLDGVPKWLLEQLAADGVMPFMAEILRTGTLHQVKVCLPEVSNVNWSSFMTGANPGAHGIFGFTDLKPNSYTLAFPSFQDLKTDTLWDALGVLGKRCLVINQPGCYPARDIPGALVSGFVAVDLKRAVAPSRHVSALEAMDYQIDVDTRGCEEHPDKLFRELDACLMARRRAADYFFGLEAWDFAEVVITGTDRLQHFHWPACQGNGPEADRAQAYYHQCDALLRHLVELFYGEDEPDGLFLLSDHGFTEVSKEFMLNAWLRNEGYLEFDQEPPDSLASIAPGSRAFAMDPGRIYLHRKGRFPKGCVEEGNGLLAELKSRLEALEEDGQKLFERVWTRNEIYEGPEAHRAPDLLCTPRKGIDVKAALKRRDVFGNSRFTGMHTWDDAFFWAGQDHGPLYISDLRAIIMDHFT